MWTLPHRLFTMRGFRRRRTACSEWTPHFGHAGLLAGRAGQLAQPRRQELPPNFQHALFACLKVSRRLIMGQRAESIDGVSCGCEHLLAEGGVQRSPPFGTAVLLTRRSSSEMATAYPADLPSRKLQ